MGKTLTYKIKMHDILSSERHLKSEKAKVYFSHQRYSHKMATAAY